jgi:hypothetical protein
MSASFNRLAIVIASTKRPPVIGSDGKRGLPAARLGLVKCWPLDPAEQQRVRDLAARLGMALDAPLDILQTMTDDNQDIKEGDILVVNSVEYPIRSVDDWYWRGSKYLTLLVEVPDER